jgi:glycogen synthase kinase 3 beta
MNPALIKIYIYQILRGLMYMSFTDIAHRDMKPHNVLINSQTNKVVICDFGSAKQLI